MITEGFYTKPDWVIAGITIPSKDAQGKARTLQMVIASNKLVEGELTIATNLQEDYNEDYNEDFNEDFALGNIAPIQKVEMRFTAVDYHGVMNKVGNYADLLEQLFSQWTPFPDEPSAADREAALALDGDPDDPEPP